jgi:subtilase family serine protease
MKRRPRESFRPCCEQLEDRGLLSVLTPAQVRHAYGVDSISFTANGQTVQGDGSGQTLAIVVADHNPYLWDELYLFDQYYSLANPSLTQVNLAGGQTNDGWAEEEALDVEWAHVMAPAASIFVVEARSDNLGDLVTAVNVARQLPGVSVVSMSWGSREFRGESAYDSSFTTPVGHNGVTFVTASGDLGAFSGAEWPASSRNVVAVGGTSLTVDAAGATVAETAWSSSGGGYSTFVSEPTYQARAQRSRRRTTPDVSMDANPGTGVAIVLMPPSTAQASWRIVGGTSLSAQMFAGLVAIADQGRSLRGAGTLDGATQTLAALYSVSSADFRDVTSGTTGYRAIRGYDLATGRGTPKAASLVADLANYGSQTAIRVVTSKAATAPGSRRTVRPSDPAPSMKPTTKTSDISGLFVVTPSDLAHAPTTRVSPRPVTVSAPKPLVLDLHLVDRAIAEMGKLRLLS